MILTGKCATWPTKRPLLIVFLAPLQRHLRPKPSLQFRPRFCLHMRPHPPAAQLKTVFRLRKSQKTHRYQKRKFARKHKQSSLVISRHGRRSSQRLPTKVQTSSRTGSPKLQTDKFRVKPGELGTRLLSNWRRQSSPVWRN